MLALNASSGRYLSFIALTKTSFDLIGMLLLVIVIRYVIKCPISYTFSFIVGQLVVEDGFLVWAAF